MRRKELLDLLQAHNIPLEKWGAGETKTFEDLLAEIQIGEASIREEKGMLVRLAEGAVLIVYHTNKFGTWRLREEKQVFRDGRERRRDLEMSIGEKMYPNEKPADAAYRALREELHITDRLPLISLPPIIKGPVPSQSFPGLTTRYVMHAFEMYLPTHLFRPEGYTEIQRDKVNYYVWELKK